MPHAHLAVVDRLKVVEYLLNAAHPDNGGKAAFFQALGFTSQRWEILAAALQSLAQAVTPVTTTESPYGQKYVIDGEIDTPSGRRARVRSVWIVDRDGDIPRLVTAYPQE